MVLRFKAPYIASTVKPGQFVNVLPKRGFTDPLLRRPFSVYQVIGDEAEIIIQRHGRGTEVLAETQAGDVLDILGPLGNPWNYGSGNYQTAVLVIGGVGVASMPLLQRYLIDNDMMNIAYYGARNSVLFADEYLSNVVYATDNGSRGTKGTIIDVLRKDLDEKKINDPKLFVCGPTKMMQAAAALAEEYDIPCEVSLETEMACGIGICQGCPIQTTPQKEAAFGRKYMLVCTHGPSFQREEIVV